MSTEQTKPKNDIRSMIAGENFKQQVALALPKHMTPDRFARVALTALTRTPKLMECTRESLLRCLMDCSQLGLEPDNRHAHLIPYENRKSGTVECTLIIDYKGLVALAKRSGEVAVFWAQLVKESDEFSWENGTVTHRIDWRQDRGKSQCVYSYVRFTSGAEDWEVMTLAEVDAVRSRSRAANAGPWVTDYDEMARKTVIRRHSKRLTLSPEFADALDKDDDRIEERPAKGREVVPAPALFFSPVDAAPPTAGPIAEFFTRVDAAKLDYERVMAILRDNQITQAEYPADITDAEASEALALWATLTKVYAEGGAK